MKKIFTLVFALGIIAVAQAQPGNRDNRQQEPRNNQPTDQRDINKGYDNGRDVVYNNPSNRYDNRNDGRYDDRFSKERRRDMEIARINREYDYKIQRVRNSFYIFRFEKERQIRMLQQDRQQEIRMVFAKYSDRRGRNNGRDRGYDKHDDRNNQRY